MKSSDRPPGGRKHLVWHCYVDGRLWPYCHFVRDEDGYVWPVFDEGCFPAGKVTLVLEHA